MEEKRKIAIIGPSVRFLSGISYYTIQLSNALSEYATVRSVLFRRMLPKKFFPGWKRVGDDLATTTFNQDVEVYEILDWYNVITWMEAAKRLRKADIIIFQWWTSSVAHMYLAIQLFLYRKVPIIIEYHEVVDTLEQSIIPVRIYSRIMGWIIPHLADHVVVHNKANKELISKIYGIPEEMITIIPLGLNNQYPVLEKSLAREKLGIEEENIILFFGLLRPYKGVRFLIQAFNDLPDNLIRSTRLLIVGEVWEDRESFSLAEKSPYRDKISMVNRYIPDDEIPLYFSASDVLVLPYTRVSQSAVAPIGMAYGLPIIATRVGGLEEGLRSYQGASFVTRESTGELTEQLVRVLEKKGTYAPPENLSWRTIGKEWSTVFESVNLQKK